MAQETPKFNIRRFQDADWSGLWNVLEPVFRAGETYPLAPDISKADARTVWIDTPTLTFVVEHQDKIIGSYYIKPNQSALGAHVCNCGYVTSPDARGMGVASAMCIHSQEAGRELGFLAMQYNLVVATNEAAVHLWQKMGFELVGTLPRAFNHKKLGLVDAHIMYKEL